MHTQLPGVQPAAAAPYASPTLAAGSLVVGASSLLPPLSQTPAPATHMSSQPAQYGNSIAGGTIPTLPQAQQSAALLALNASAHTLNLPAPEHLRPAPAAPILLPPNPSLVPTTLGHTNTSMPVAQPLNLQHTVQQQQQQLNTVVSLPAAGHTRSSAQKSSQVVPISDDGLPVEDFIPFRLPDLRDQLIMDYPQVFHSAEVQTQFTQLCRWLSARNTLRLALAFGDAKEKYAYLDPDNDSEDPGAGRMSQSEKEGLQQDFERELLAVLDKGAFEELSEEELQGSATVQGVRGLEVEPCDPNLVKFKFWYRGRRTKQVEYRGWRSCYMLRKVPTTIYTRIALLFKSPPEQDVEHYLEQHGERTWGKFFWQIFRRCFGRKRVSLSEHVTLDPGYVYLKLFKEVELADLDMLLPGAEAKFTWIDWCMIWVPIVVGVVMAIWKAATGTIDFSNLTNAVLSVVLIVMPLTWGLKAYMAVKDKMANYQAYLNALVLTHNLDNNAGVVTGVLDEAQEQEDNESLLAYFFLWRGMLQPAPMSKQELDTVVEAYLKSLIQKQDLGIRLDFEVGDSISKLEAMGLLANNTTADGQQALQVLPLAQALQQAHPKNFNEALEVMGARGMGRLATAARDAAAKALPPWQECMGTYPATGQKFRYWFNAETGESTYTQPEGYVPLLTSTSSTLGTNPVN